MEARTRRRMHPCVCASVPSMPSIASFLLLRLFRYCICSIYACVLPCMHLFHLCMCASMHACIHACMHPHALTPPQLLKTRTNRLAARMHAGLVGCAHLCVCVCACGRVCNYLVAVRVCVFACVCVRARSLARVHLLGCCACVYVCLCVCARACN